MNRLPLVFTIPFFFKTVSAASENTPPSVLTTSVITATRSETPQNQIASSITVITAEEIAQRQVTTVAEALRMVPGVDIVSSGGPGKTTVAYLRGAGSQHTLVVIDGVEMNDPSTPNNLFDFSNLTVDNIERIEVLRGGGSAMYGSDAIGGVIHIITRKGHGKTEFSASVQGGAYNSFRTEAAVRGENETLHYSMSSSHSHTQGFSAADERWGNRESDGYENTTVDTRVGGKVLENMDLGWNLRYSSGKTYLDGAYPTVHDDPNFKSTSDELYTRAFSHSRVLDGMVEQTLGVAYSRNDRQYHDQTDPANPFAISSDYLGEKIKVDSQTVFRFHKDHTVTLGMENETDRLSSESDFSGSKAYSTQGYYLIDRFGLWDRAFTTAAVRYDYNAQAGDQVTWRIGHAFLLQEMGTTLKANYGTGFKLPTLFDLYDRYTGNPNLLPETSNSWDVGIEHILFKDALTVSLTYFNNRFDDLIHYSFSKNKVENIQQATAEGIEQYVVYTPFSELTFRSGYTYTRSKDRETGQRLEERPTHKGYFEIHYQFIKQADVDLNIFVVGDKNDVGMRRVPGYVLANLAASYPINEHLRIFARLDNIFDKQYQEVYGYGTSRLAGYGGVTLRY